MTALCDRTLRAGGPAMLFENPAATPCRCWAICLARPERVARAMGVAE
jgi:4-hydroxy-3-polyprenylbenzoate decarboxylase